MLILFSEEEKHSSIKLFLILLYYRNCRTAVRSGQGCLYRPWSYSLKGQRVQHQFINKLLVGRAPTAD